MKGGLERVLSARVAVAKQTQSMSEVQQIVEFGPYRLDMGRRLLIRDLQPVILQPKTFDLLVLLVRRQGDAISKDELMDALWPDTSVQEASLTFQVSTL